jgi:thymidylate synthase (FAD)
MKIINPSAEIIEDELSQLSIHQRIAYCAGVCYQREPNKTEEDAQEFCRKMLNVKHMSTMEMATIHIATSPYDYIDSRYVHSTEINGTTRIITGSIRAFREAADEYGSHIWNFLADELPIFFAESDPPKGNVRWATPDEIPWQHHHVAVRIIVNRAVSHELVRHRPCSFLQESQRYCRYEDEVVFIRPEWFGTGKGSSESQWIFAMEDASMRYEVLLRDGLKPQQARAVLPNSTKTELICYASLPQWKHMFDLRCSPAADPEMIRVMVPLREEFKQRYPEAAF